MGQDHGMKFKFKREPEPRASTPDEMPEWVARIGEDGYGHGKFGMDRKEVMQRLKRIREYNEYQLEQDQARHCTSTIRVMELLRRWGLKDNKEIVKLANEFGYRAPKKDEKSSCRQNIPD